MIDRRPDRFSKPVRSWSGILWPGLSKLEGSNFFKNQVKQVKLNNMQPEACYYIYNHANGNDNLFQTSENYRYFLQQWAKEDLTGFRNLSGLGQVFFGRVYQNWKVPNFLKIRLNK
ncbi:hypothetical protein [Reichenbachiella sp. MALMAid0571]|uniref:hypothetical protein n=1 Tax=Reichenbachiella sp. MALMAid0571 TaxID=3143939 RepID=UPI0032DF1D1C